ncbi:ABC transporter ATP-binding protein [Thermotalea metallivorans]|uniref:Aliphatic sulfonates import ATP-binding protein SsuB n=1 Tax=Thermotalea metallivorans TaxID=520762 RepID=A0A140LBE8_9FIRM|nr:ABC transporter ATP-binding protein [Thermotalea metallivorans]KXG77873.1 Aliphatic sulfonates import ATP-binding protein SsuB [Thermotalea metallivorans]
MIETRDLTVVYKSRNSCYTALDKITMAILEGETCALIGPSGCGKSTLLKVLAGIIREFEGQVAIKNQPVMPKRHRIGFIPQNYGLLDWKNVYQNVTLGLRIKDGKKKIDRNDIAHILDLLGLKGLEERYPNELSGGQQQRAALARAFLLKPDLLLMDEPFSALDAITREEIQDVFLYVWKKNPVSTILVTHHVEEAVYLGKKIVILSDSPGRILKILDNPLFGENDLRNKEDYFQMCLELRKIIKEDWSK